MFEVWSQFNVVEESPVNISVQAHPSAVPCRMQARVCAAQVACQGTYLVRFGITAHECHAGDVALNGSYNLVESIDIKRCADVLPQITAMAVRTTAWAVGDIDGKCCLIGYFREDDAGVDVFQHG